MIDLELQSVTVAGRRFVELADKHAVDFAGRADVHDRQGSFPFESWDAMKESGFLAACVPEELGGLGVTRMLDVAAGFNRLGRGDGAVTIGSHMHVLIGWTMAQAWRRGGAWASAVEPLLRGMVSGEVVFTVAGTESGTAPGYPQAEAVPVDGGYRLTGRKVFATNSPVATWFWVVCRVPDGKGDWLSGGALVPRATPGLEVHDDWDALGMRASGSNSVTFTDCFVPTASLATLGRIGELNRFWISLVVNTNIGLLGGFLGMAEAAHEWVVNAARSRRKAPSGRTLAELGGVQRLVAESEVDLAVCRSMIERTCRLADEVFGDEDEPAMEDAELLLREFQCAKLTVNRKAIEVVDRALTASGGAGYLNRSGPLARLYRDVRAGPFMQAYSPVEAYDYIGRTALGVTPAVDV